MHRGCGQVAVLNAGSGWYKDAACLVVLRNNSTHTPLSHPPRFYHRLCLDTNPFSSFKPPAGFPFFVSLVSFRHYPHLPNLALYESLPPHPSHELHWLRQEQQELQLPSLQGLPPHEVQVPPPGLAGCGTSAEGTYSPPHPLPSFMLARLSNSTTQPAAPRVEPASRVSSVPSSVRVNGQPYVPRREDGRSSASIERATVSSTGSARIDNSAFNTRGSSPSSSGSQPYRKETYKDRQDPRYDNTGPPYDPSSSALPPHHQQVVGDTKARGYNDLADRFADQARISSVHSGNHSDQPTYGRDGLYRTASDMESHDSYKRNEDRLRDAKQPYASASQQAPRMQKHTDPQNHLTVADIHGRVGDEHRR
jgi:hypothetical protein